MGKMLQNVITTDAEGNKKLVVAEVALGDGKDLLSIDITDTNYKAGTETFELEMAQKETSILFNRFPQFEVVDVEVRKKEEKDLIAKAEEMKNKQFGGKEDGKDNKNGEKAKEEPKKVGQSNDFFKKDEKSKGDADNSEDGSIKEDEDQGLEASGEEKHQEFYNLADKLMREGFLNELKGANLDKYQQGAVGYVVIPAQEEGELPQYFFVTSFTTRYVGKKLVYMETQIPYTSQHTLTIKVRKGKLDFDVYNTNTEESIGGNSQKQVVTQGDDPKNPKKDEEKEKKPKKVDKNNAVFLEDMGVDISGFEVDENGNITDKEFEFNLDIPEDIFPAGVIRNKGTYYKDDNYQMLRDFAIIDNELQNLDHIYKNALIENEYAGTKLIVNADEADDMETAKDYAQKTRQALKNGMVVEIGDLDDGNWENLAGNMASSKEAFDIYYTHRAKMMLKIARKDNSDGEGGAQKGSMETYANQAVQEYFMNDKRMIIEPQLAHLMEIIASLHLDMKFDEGLYIECNIPVHQERPSKEEIERISFMVDKGFMTQTMGIMEANGVTKGKAKVIEAETSIKMQEEKDREMMQMQEQGEGNPEQNGGNPFNEKKDPMGKTKPKEEKEE